MKHSLLKKSLMIMLAGVGGGKWGSSPAEGAEIFWLGTGSGDFSGNNWAGTVGGAVVPSLIPVDGDALYFDTAATDFAGVFAVTNDLGLFGLGLAINDQSAVADFTISGNAIGLGAGGISSTVGVGTGSMLSFEGIALGAAASFVAVAGDLTINSTVDNGGNLLTVSGLGNTIINGSVSGLGGLTKTGGGALTLAVANSYTGETTVSGGTVIAGDVDVLGTGAALVVNGGTVNLGLNNQSVGAVTLGSGSLVGTGAFLTSSAFVLESGMVGVKLGGVGATLTKTTAGTVTLSGANSFTGRMSVEAGVISMGTINNVSAAGVLGNSGLSVILGKAGGQTGTLQYTGATASSSKPFTLATGGGGVFQVDNVATVLTVSGLIDGGGGLSKTGPGNLVISNATNTYSGGTKVSGGILTASRSGTGTFSFGGTLTLESGVSLYPNTGGGLLTIGTEINLAGGNATIKLDNGNGNIANTDLAITGQITGGGRLIVTGLNNGNRRKFELQSANTFSGGVTMQATPTSAGLITRTRLVIYTKTSLGSGTLRAELPASVGSTIGGLEVPSANTSNSGVNVGLETGTGVMNAIDLATGANLNVTTSQTNALQLSGVISGAGSLTTRAPNTNPANLAESNPANLPGLLILSGANTYTGSTLINAGTLQIGNGGTAGSLSPSSALVIQNPNAAANGSVGGNINNYLPTLALNRADTLTQGVDFAAVISGNLGQLVQKGSGTTILTGTNTYSGLTTVQAGTLILRHATDTIANGAAVLVSGGTLEVENLESVGVVTMSSGAISGVGTLTGTSYGLTNTGTMSVNLGVSGAILTKTGAGTVSLSGVNGYTGGTVISGGVLGVNGDEALGGVGGAVTMSSGGTLRADGTVTTGGRTLTLGVGGGVIDSNGNEVHFNSGSSVTGTTLTKTGGGGLNFGLGSGLTGLSGLVVNDGVVKVDSGLGVGVSAVSVTGLGMVEFGSVNQTLGSLSIGAGSVVTFSGGVAAFGGGGKGGLGGALVPEPGTIGLLLAGGLGLLGWRRRG